MIRLAALEDESSIASLCKKINEEDYVLEHIHRWILCNEVYLYERDAILGMIRLLYSRDGKAHLGAIRVHPACRRQGIGTHLTDYCIGICGTDTVRLSIMSNLPSQRLAEKCGFIPVATFTLLELQQEISKTGSCVCGSLSPQKAFSRFQASSQGLQNHSLLSSSFTFYHPSLSILQDLCILAHGENMAILDYDIDEAVTRSVQIAFCDADFHLIQCILGEAVRTKCEEIWAILYKGSEVIPLLTEHGFELQEWAETITVYELNTVYRN